MNSVELSTPISMASMFEPTPVKTLVEMHHKNSSTHFHLQKSSLNGRSDLMDTYLLNIDNQHHHTRFRNAAHSQDVPKNQSN